MRHALTGAVAAIQRTDSSLRLNLHFHVLVLDGVYVRDPTTRELEFHSLPTPTTEEVADVALRTAQRLDKLLRAKGRSLLPDEYPDPEPLALQLDHPALAACYDAASRGLTVSGNHAGQPSLRLVQSEGTPPATSHQDVPAAEVLGVNLYAKQVIDGRDRRQLERLCRYLLRPPIAEERLSLRSDGTLLLEFTGRLRRLPSFARHRLLPWKAPARWTLSTPVQEVLARRHAGRRPHPAGPAPAPVCSHSVTVRQPSPLLRCARQCSCGPRRGSAVLGATRGGVQTSACDG